MVKMTLEVEGMMCHNCEKHVNEAIKSGFDVKKVTSSHEDKQTVIIANEELDEAALKAAVSEAGYEMKSCKSEPYKKGLFG
ncbi:MAG: heavy-metal-associated domain-containing protein [Ruminococcus sp.]|nr:heavy-metal-associated domain-containing protein [Ruminococcus sp.]